MFGASKKMGDLGDEVAHTGYVENISCFRGQGLVAEFESLN